MRFNSRFFQRKFTRAALKKDLHDEFAEFKALLVVFGSAGAVLEIWNDYVHYA